MRKILVFWIGLFFLPVAARQTEPVLTKKQMYQDFDSLRQTIRSYWAQAEIQRLVTGRDINRELDDMRVQIDTVTGYAGFYDVMTRLLFTCNDQHVSWDFPNGFPKKVIESSRQKWSDYYRYSFRQYIPIRYIDGRYYTMEVADKNDRPLIPEGSRIVAVSGMPIDRYVAEVNRRMQANTLWDWKHKKFYTIAINDPRTLRAASKYTWTYLDKGKKHTVDMDGAQVKRRGARKNAGFLGAVYFEPEGILFIRVPAMDYSKIEELKESILKHKSKAIRQIIIDVRYNGGGDDRTWREMLGVLIDRDLTVNLSIAFKNKEQVEYIQPHYKRATPIEPLIVGTDTLYNFSYEHTVERAPESLDFPGKIYVLFDRDFCYSSTGSFKSICNRSDRLVSVGQPSGFLLGVGSPMYGCLDESLIAYRLSRSVETTGVRKGHPEDFYQSRVEIPVKMPSYDRYYRILYNYTGDLYGKEFLYNYDPWFRKVLKTAKVKVE